MPLQAFDEMLDYVERALCAEQEAKAAETPHLAALWRELATTYRELAEHQRGRLLEAGGPGQTGRSQPVSSRGLCCWGSAPRPVDSGKSLCRDHEARYGDDPLLLWGQLSSLAA
jgi:hypothetical protein